MTETDKILPERDQLNEDIVRTLRKLNAISRRGPGPRPPDSPRPGENGPEGFPEPDMQREHGRGRIMGTLHDHGPMSQSRLAELLEIRPQSLSELIVRMEDDGLVARAQSGEDRRQIIVSLTEEGSRRVYAFREAHRRHAAQFLSPLTDEEKITLCALLKKLTDAPRPTLTQDRNPAETQNPGSGAESSAPAGHD